MVTRFAPGLFTITKQHLIMRSTITATAATTTTTTSSVSNDMVARGSDTKHGSLNHHTHFASTKKDNTSWHSVQTGNIILAVQNIRT